MGVEAVAELSLSSIKARVTSTFRQSPKSATDLAQGTNQLATFADPRFGKQDAESFLKSPAPNSSIMNRIRLFAHQHFGEQGDEFLEAR